MRIFYGLLALLCSCTTQKVGDLSSGSPLERYVSAIGGREKVERLRSLYVEYALTGENFSGVIRQWTTAEGKVRTETEVGQATRTTGFDGSSAWVLPYGGPPEIVAGPERAAQVATAYLASYSHIIPGRLPGEVTRLGRKEREGKSFDVVEVRTEESAPTLLYFDPESGLLAFSEYPSPQGATRSSYQEWKEVEGLKLPSRQTIQSGGQTLTLTLTSARLNAPVSKDTFAPPPGTLSWRFAKGKETKIPFEMMGGHIFVPVQIDEKGPLWFILDSGAGLTALDRSTAERLGFAVESAGQAVGSTGLLELGVANASTLSLPGLSVDIAAVGVLDLSSLTARQGRPIEGLLGYDFFRRFQVTIDYEAQELTIREPEAAPAGEGVALPLEIPARRPVVTATLAKEISGRFVVDTGAPASLYLGRSFVEANRLEERFGQKMLVGSDGGLGEGGEARLARLPALSLGSLTMERPLAIFGAGEAGAPGEGEIAGFLGQRFLSRFLVTFDYPNRRMVLKDTPGKKGPDTFDPSGLRFRLEGEEVVISWVRTDSPAARAGVPVGARLLSVDGKPVRRENLGKVEALLSEDGQERTIEVAAGEEVKRFTLRLRSPI